MNKFGTIRPANIPADSTANYRGMQSLPQRGEEIREPGKQNKLEIIRLAFKVMSLQGGLEGMVNIDNEAEVLKFYEEHKLQMTGPIQQVIKDLFQNLDRGVDVPEEIQSLFMDAERTLVDVGVQRSERNEEMASRFRERK